MALFNHVSARSALHVGVVFSHGPVHLGRQDDPVPLSAAFQSFPRDFLTDAAGIYVRGVYEIDPLSRAVATIR